MVRVAGERRVETWVMERGLIVRDTLVIQIIAVFFDPLCLGH